MRRNRIAGYAGVLFVIGLVVALAYYQEPLAAFFRLRMWDRSAPARTVATFLEAGRRGDRAGADRLLGTNDYQPLIEKGRWTGYFVVTQAGRMDIRIAELAPPGEVKATRTEFMTIGNGAAHVTVPNRSGTPIVYRLEIKGDGWKITEIRGGRPAPAAPAPPGNRSRRGGPGPPGR